MPMYRWRCPDCGAEERRVVPIRERVYPRYCRCGTTMDRIIEAPGGQPPAGIRFSRHGTAKELSGRIVGNAREADRLMREHGRIPVELHREI